MAQGNAPIQNRPRAQTPTTFPVYAAQPIQQVGSRVVMGTPSKLISSRTQQQFFPSNPRSYSAVSNVSRASTYSHQPMFTQTMTTPFRQAQTIRQPQSTRAVRQPFQQQIQFIQPQQMQYIPQQLVLQKPQLNIPQTVSRDATVLVDKEQPQKKQQSKQHSITQQQTQVPRFYQPSPVRTPQVVFGQPRVQAPQQKFVPISDQLSGRKPQHQASQQQQQKQQPQQQLQQQQQQPQRFQPPQQRSISPLPQQSRVVQPRVQTLNPFNIRPAQRAQPQTLQQPPQKRKNNHAADNILSFSKNDNQYKPEPKKDTNLVQDASKKFTSFLDNLM